MKKGKVFLLWFAGIVLWGLAFSFLTPLISKVSTRTLKTKQIDFEQETPQVFLNIDSVNISKNIFGDAFIAGWAFIENEDDNPDKKINLVLRSNEVSYLVETTTIDRFDLRISPFLENFAVPLSRNGFEARFSPISMKDGVYRLYLEVIEREAQVGIGNAGVVFVKEGNEFVHYQGGAPLTPEAGLERGINDQIQAHFTCWIKGEIVLVSGWAIPALESEQGISDPPVIKVLNENGEAQYFSSVSETRFDVANHFENLNFLLSGFSAEIPRKDLQEGQNKISILLPGWGESGFYCIPALENEVEP